LRTQLADAQLKLSAKAAAPVQPVQSMAPTAKANFGEGVEVTETASAVTVTLPDAILFDSGKAALKDSSKATLDRIVAVLKKDYPGRMIQVVGHTDDDPIKRSEWKDNWELSCQRALAVSRHLIVKGVDPKTIEATGRGEFAPRAKSDTAAGKARNRRVEIVITK